METNTDIKAIPHESVLQSTIAAPYNSLNLLQQTRTAYDPSALAELADSMILYDENGNPAGLNLLQSPRVAAFDSPEEALSYLADLNAYHGTAYTPEDLKSVGGTARVVIFGHRRVLAYKMAAEKAGIDISQVPPQVIELRGVTFDDALVMQLLENIHDRPSLEDEADAIHKYYEYRKFRHPENIPPTIVEVSKKLGFGEAKVSNALRYAQLPESAKDLVVEKKITYSDAVNIWVLHEAHTIKGKKLEAEGLLKNTANPTADAFAADATTTDALYIAKYRQVPAKDSNEQWKKWGAKEIEAFIGNRLKTIRQETFESDGLFYLDTDMAISRRETVYRGLGDGALKALEILASYNPDSIPREALAKFLAAKPAEFTQDLFEG